MLRFLQKAAAEGKMQKPLDLGGVIVVFSYIEWSPGHGSGKPKNRKTGDQPFLVS
jgi:hypothetical protein